MPTAEDRCRLPSSTVPRLRNYSSSRRVRPFNEGYWQLLLSVLVIFVPVLSMRTFAEERREGTLDLLRLSQASTWAQVLGKFGALCALIFLVLLLAAMLPFSSYFFSGTEFSVLVVAWLGCALTGAAFVSIGLAASAFTRSPAAAAAFGIGALLLLCLVDEF